MHVIRRTVNSPVEKLMKLLICPLLCLERTITVFAHQPRTANSERFDPGFFFLLWCLLLFKQPYIIIPIQKLHGISMLLFFQFDLDFSYLISEPIHASWRSVCCHFPLPGGTLFLSREVHWSLLWPYLRRALFSLPGFSCHFLAACPPVS